MIGISGLPNFSNRLIFRPRSTLLSVADHIDGNRALQNDAITYVEKLLKIFTNISIELHETEHMNS